MPLKIFGFTILTPRDKAKENTPSIAPPQNVDGAATVYENGVGAFGASSLDLDAESASFSEYDMINQYRQLALQPEVDEAINDIVNELVVRDDDVKPVSLNVEALPEGEYGDDFKTRVREEFDYVLKLLDFNDHCYEIMRQFYVDGRLYYDLVIDNENPTDGVLEVRQIDPRTIRPVRQLKESIDANTGVKIVEVTGEYYVYNPMGFRSTTNQQHLSGIPLTKDRVAYVNSGVYTQGYTAVLSHLHKAIKPFNQLRMVEDATVIYRITRAPERRVFYIDVGDLPAHRAEQHLNSVAAKYRNRMVYDSLTGETRDDRKIQSMLEDFFLPRRGSTGKGTEVTTLQGGQNLGVMEDVEYFKRKLYKALNVPVSRIDGTNSSAGSSLFQNRTSEIGRDEIKFGRFLSRLRARFAELFDQILARHLFLIGVLRTPEQWEDLRRYIKYDFVKDSHFSELKELEILNQRLDVVQKLEPYIGRYYSTQFVRDHILRQNPDEQSQIDQEIEEDPDAQLPHDQFGRPLPELPPADGTVPFEPGDFGGKPAPGAEFISKGGKSAQQDGAEKFGTGGKKAFGQKQGGKKKNPAKKGKSPVAEETIDIDFTDLDDLQMILTESED